MFNCLENKFPFFCESRTTNSDIGEEREINIDIDKLKMAQDDVKNNDCEAYGVAHAVLTTRPRINYEEVF